MNFTIELLKDYVESLGRQSRALEQEIDCEAKNLDKKSKELGEMLDRKFQIEADIRLFSRHRDKTY